MKYQLNDIPKPLHMFLYGVQWFTAILPSLIIITGVVSGLYTQDSSLSTIFTQKAFLVTGIALMVQVLYGHKLPILMGPATILLIGLTSTLNLSPQASFTAMAIGGLILILFSFGKFFNYVQKLFTTRVIVVTLMLVAVTISPLIISLSSGVNGEIFTNLLFALGLTLIMILGNSVVQGVWKSLVIFVGLVAGSITYIAIFGVPHSGQAIPYQWSVFFENFAITPEFNLSAIVSFIFCFFAVTVNELGAIQATGQFIGADNIAQRGKRGIRVSGIFNVISGAMGIVGVVDYSMSPGIISATQSASRYPLVVAGALIVICALIPQSLLIFAYIPQVIMGSVLLYVMCTQLASGIQLMTSTNSISGFNNAITIAFPVMIGIFISFAPPEFNNTIPNLLKPIVGNGFIMGIISVLLLEHILNKK